MGILGAATTLLFVPGDRPERFAKAEAAGADLVVIDLEDAVSPAAKDDARAAALEWQGTAKAAVRINATGTPWHHADVTALAADGVPRLVVVPKADAASLVAAASALPAGTELLALVETAAGVLDAAAIAAVPGVARLAIGTYDLAAELGVDPDDAVALAAARGALVLASAAAGLPAPVDGVTGAVRDPERLAADVAAARRLGFGGKLCIHPTQVGPTARGFAPRPVERDWARRVVTAVDSAGGGVCTVDGRMIDEPVVVRARRILDHPIGRNDPATPTPGDAHE